MRTGIAVATLWLVLAFGWQSAAAQDPNRLETRFARAVITAEGEYACHRLGVYLAENAAQRARGLMYVTELPDDQGMLFVYPVEYRVSMWMKNTLIPLDMLFIRSDGRIANVVADTRPLSVESIYATEPVSAVLELNAGAAARLGLAPGRRIYVGHALSGR